MIPPHLTHLVAGFVDGTLDEARLRNWLRRSRPIRGSVPTSSPNCGSAALPGWRGIHRGSKMAWPRR